MWFPNTAISQDPRSIQYIEAPKERFEDRVRRYEREHGNPYTGVKKTVGIGGALVCVAVTVASEGTLAVPCAAIVSGFSYGLEGKEELDGYHQGPKTSEELAINLVNIFANLVSFSGPNGGGFYSTTTGIATEIAK